MSQIKLQLIDLEKAQLMLNQVDLLLRLQKECFTKKGMASRTKNPDLFKESEELLNTCKGLERVLRHDLDLMKGPNA